MGQRRTGRHIARRGRRASLILIAVSGLAGGDAEAQSPRYCATQRALGRFPPGCPQPTAPLPVPRPPPARPQPSPVRTHPLILRSGCSERLQVVLEYRTARGFERTPEGSVSFVLPGETSSPVRLRGRQLALVSDEIYYLVFPATGIGWRPPLPSGAPAPWARAAVSVRSDGAYMITFCRAPGTQIDVPGRYLAYFVWGTDEVTPEMANVLNEAASSYARLGDPSYRVIVAGHAYVEGRDIDVVAISRRRAANVRAYLVSRGVPAGSIAIEALGDSRPAIEGQTEDVRVQNRRVEIIFGAGPPG